MGISALWSAPRARSTAFFRSMAERGDLTVLHEPFSNLRDYGETDGDGRTFDSPARLLAWLRDQAHRRNVFLKDTMDHQHDEVLATGGSSPRPGTRSSSAAPRKSRRPTTPCSRR